MDEIDLVFLYKHCFEGIDLSWLEGADKRKREEEKEEENNATSNNND